MNELGLLLALRNIRELRKKNRTPNAHTALEAQILLKLKRHKSTSVGAAGSNNSLPVDYNISADVSTTGDSFYGGKENQAVQLNENDTNSIHAKKRGQNIDQNKNDTYHPSSPPSTEKKRRRRNRRRSISSTKSVKSSLSSLLPMSPSSSVRSRSERSQGSSTRKPTRTGRGGGKVRVKSPLTETTRTGKERRKNRKMISYHDVINTSRAKHKLNVNVKRVIESTLKTEDSEHDDSRSDDRYDGDENRETIEFSATTTTAEAECEEGRCDMQTYESRTQSSSASMATGTAAVETRGRAIGGDSSGRAFIQGVNMEDAKERHVLKQHLVNLVLQRVCGIKTVPARRPRNTLSESTRSVQLNSSVQSLLNRWESSRYTSPLRHHQQHSGSSSSTNESGYQHRPQKEKELNTQTKSTRVQDRGIEPSPIALLSTRGLATVLTEGYPSARKMQSPSIHTHTRMGLPVTPEMFRSRSKRRDSSNENKDFGDDSDEYDVNDGRDDDARADHHGARERRMTRDTAFLQFQSSNKKTPSQSTSKGQRNARSTQRYTAQSKSTSKGTSKSKLRAESVADRAKQLRRREKRRENYIRALLTGKLGIKATKSRGRNKVRKTEAERETETEIAAVTVILEKADRDTETCDMKTGGKDGDGDEELTKDSHLPVHDQCNNDA